MEEIVFYRPTVDNLSELRRAELKEVVEARLRTIADNDNCEDEADYILAHGYCRDGYQIARVLEDDFGWDVDSSMIDDLDMINSDVRDFLEKELRRRVAFFKVTPPCGIGTRVAFERRHRGTTTLLIGYVIGIDRDLAEATVYVESEGHLPPNMPFMRSMGSVTYGIIVNYESLYGIEY